MRQLVLLGLLVTTIVCGCGGGGGGTGSSTPAAQLPSSGTVSTSPVSATALTVTPAPAFGMVGTMVQLTATAKLTNGTTQDVTNSVTWSSNAASVASVSSGGRVTAASLGQATVTATAASGATSSVTFTVNSAGTTFTVRDGSPQLNDVTFGNGLFVACGEDQVVYRSTDGVTWTSDITGLSAVTTFSAWSAVTFGSGLFAVGGGGVVATSPDGVTWTQRLNDSQFSLNQIVFLNGQFIAVGSRTVPNVGASAVNIYTSPDGITWTQRNSGTTSTLANVTFGAGLFVATPSGSSNFSTSPDGVTWTLGNLVGANSGVFTGPMVFANGRFTGLGQAVVNNSTIATLITSSDGLHWTVTPNSALAPLLFNVLPDGMCFTQGNFVIASESGGLFTSPDMTSLNAQPYNPAVSLGTVQPLNGTVVAVGAQGIILTSSDTQHWTTRSVGSLAASLAGVAVGDNLYATAGFGGNIETSADGHTWTPHATPYNIGFDGNNGILNAIAFGDDVFVSVGTFITGAGSIVVSSADGSTWAAQQPAAGTVQSGVAFGNGLFVSVGNFGSIQTSPDGVVWTLRTSNTTDALKAVTFMPGPTTGLFVAVGANGRIVTSPDGLNWSVRVSGTSKNLNGVTNQNGQLAAVGGGGTILTSPDGITWGPSTSGTANALFGAFSGNGLFVAVGANGTLLTSPDANTWTSRASHTLLGLFGGAFNNGQLVVVGGDGDAVNVMLSSP